MTLTAGLSASGAVLPTLTAKAGEAGRVSGALSPSEEEFRNGVMPRAQLSILASQLAVEKATQMNAREFAGFELMEAIAVVKVLREVGTPAHAADDEGRALIEKLTSATGNEFDKLYLSAQLANHEFLRDLTNSFLAGAGDKTSPADNESRHLATIALFAFNEHVALTKRIYREVTV